MTMEDTRVLERAQQLEQSEQTAGGKVLHRLVRIVVRTARVAAGAALAIFALYLLGEVLDVLDTPFPAMTLGKVLVGILCAIGSLVFFGWAWSAAFGPAPTADERRAQHLASARAAISERERVEAKAERDRQSNAAVIAFFRGIGRKVGGMLHRR